MCQSSSNNHNDNNSSVNVNFDKKKQPKTSYTTCNPMNNRLSSTFNEKSSSSSTSNSKRPINRKSLVSCTQPRIGELRIDANVKDEKNFSRIDYILYNTLISVCFVSVNRSIRTATMKLHQVLLILC